MKNIGALLGLVLVAVVASGCASNPPTPTTDPPARPDGSNEAPRNPLPILMSCQMQPHVTGPSQFDYADLSCTYQPPANAPFTAFVAITANGPNPIAFDASSAGVARTVTRVDAGRLPLQVQAQIILNPGQVAGLSASTYSLTQSFQFTAGDTTSGTVHTVSLPFSIWTVKIAYQTDFPGALLNAYSLDFGASSPASPIMAQTSFAPGSSGGSITAYLPVGPDTNSLTGKLFDSAQTPITLTSGGSYLFDAMGLHSGTAPTTSCGSDGQAPCVDSSGATFCNAGSVASADGLCHSCGNDGQPRCQDSMGATFCNDGFVYGSADGLCHACGNESQPQCQDSRGATFCNTGFVYSSADSLCHACGNDSQPQCQDSTGATFCNNGFVYSSADGLCHVQ